MKIVKVSNQLLSGINIHYTIKGVSAPSSTCVDSWCGYCAYDASCPRIAIILKNGINQNNYENCEDF